MFQFSTVVRFKDCSIAVMYEGFRATRLSLDQAKAEVQRRIRDKLELIRCKYPGATLKELSKKEYQRLPEEVKQQIESDWLTDNKL